MPDVEEKNPEPDLDELLEQFREPEEKPRRKSVPGSVWLMLALILSVGGVWLALRVATGAATAIATAGPMKPGKSSERKLRENRDAMEEYLARCEKGMTAREVRWIVEDFQKEGLDDGLGSFNAIVGSMLEPLDISEAGTRQLLELSIGTEPANKLKSTALVWANRQQDWYSGAMAEALQLSWEQKLEMKAAGRRFVKACEGDFFQLKEAFADEKDGGPTKSYMRDRIYSVLLGKDLLFPATGLLDPSYWLQQSSSAPAERIQLSPQQEEVFKLGKDSKVVLPSRLEGVEAVLPVMPEQKFPADDHDIVRLAEALHPAQLKVLLLLKPAIATELTEALENSDE